MKLQIRNACQRAHCFELLGRAQVWQFAARTMEKNYIWTKHDAQQSRLIEYETSDFALRLGKLAPAPRK